MYFAWLMTTEEWLARESAVDRADGLPPTLTDQTALRLLAVGMTEARKPTQPPVVPLVPLEGS